MISTVSATILTSAWGRSAIDSMLCRGAGRKACPIIFSNLILRGIPGSQRPDGTDRPGRTDRRLMDRASRLSIGHDFTYGATPPIAGRMVVVVDDGIAIGGTMRAALRVVRHHGAMRVVLAVPGSPARDTGRSGGRVRRSCVPDQAVRFPGGRGPLCRFPAGGGCGSAGSPDAGAHRDMTEIRPSGTRLLPGSARGPFRRRVRPRKAFTCRPARVRPLCHFRPR